MKGLDFAQLGDVIRRGANLVLTNPIMLLPMAISLYVQTFLMPPIPLQPYVPPAWSELMFYLLVVTGTNMLGNVIVIKMSFDSLREKADLGAALTLSVRKVFPVMGAIALVVLFVLLGGLLFVIPGLIIGLKLIFVLHLIVLEDYGVTEAIAVAWKMTDGRSWWLLALLLPWVLLAVLAATIIEFLPATTQMGATFVYGLLYNTLGTAVLTSTFDMLRPDA